jgi:hypothetical protein
MDINIYKSIKILLLAYFPSSPTIPAHILILSLTWEGENNKLAKELAEAFFYKWKKEMKMIIHTSNKNHFQ